jgi:hypothetical protein
MEVSKMINTAWIIVSVGTAALVTIAGIIAHKRMSVFPPRERRAFNLKLFTLGGSLVALGIIFGTDRLIAYSFIGAGLVLEVTSVIKAKRKEQRPSAEMK